MLLRHFCTIGDAEPGILYPGLSLKVLDASSGNQGVFVLVYAKGFE
jgi:hypothetical protein